MSDDIGHGQICRVLGRPFKLTGAQGVEMPHLVLKFHKRPENWSLETPDHSVDAKTPKTGYLQVQNDSTIDGYDNLNTPFVMKYMFEENSGTRQENLAFLAETDKKTKPATQGVGGTRDIYVDHFSRPERPFLLVANPDFLFWASAHRLAFAMLEYGVLIRSPITLVTGEVGAGKTTLVHHLLKTIGDGIKIGLDENTVHSYVGYRLRVAGAARNILSKTATQLISEATGGVPRLVNQMCDLSMVYAFTKKSKRIMRTPVQQVLDDGAFFGANFPESKDDISQ